MRSYGFVDSYIILLLVGFNEKTGCFYKPYYFKEYIIIIIIIIISTQYAGRDVLHILF